MKFDIESSTTTPDVMSRRQANMQALKNLKAIVERLPFQDQDVDITDQNILEMVAAIAKIFNSGLDMSQLQSPSISNAHGGFYCHLFQTIANRKSTKFIQKHLSFLKQDRLKEPIWILLELNSKTLLDFIQSGETHSKYLNNSAIRQGELLDIIDSYYAKQINLYGAKVKDPPTPVQKDQVSSKTFFPMPPNIATNMEGDLFDRFQQFEDIQPIKHIQSLDCDDNTTHAPSHRKQELETPDIGFGSPLQQQDSILEDEIIEQKEEDHKEPLYMSFQCKKSAKLMRDYRDKEQEHFWHSLQEPVPNFTEKCEQCGVKIKKSFLFFTKGTARYCHFSGNYYCCACISQQPSIIPYLVINKFDFNEYDVSIEAYNQIKDNSKKPIFQINYFDNVVYDNVDLYDFLVLRRSLRLMNDLLCQDFYFSAQFQSYQNLLLPINLFSLINLQDIKSGYLQKIVQSALSDGYTHIKNCPVCIKLGINCAECQKGQIFIFDIVQTQYCRKCKKLFHRACFNAKCSKCGQDQHLNRKKLIK